MKKYTIICFAFVFLIIFTFIGYLIVNNYKGINLISILSPFHNKPLSASIAVNTAQFYYGMNVEMSQILPSSERYIVNSQGKDLIDISADLGINMLRITNSTRSFNDNKDAIYTQTQWYTVLDKMQRKGIRAIILIETASNNGDYYSRDIRPVNIDLVNSYVIDSGVLNHPNVYAVDIKNEPIITQNNLSYLKKASEMIKAKYSHILITIGWWGSQSGDINADVGNSNNQLQWDNYHIGKLLDPFIDFYSIHMYGFDKKKLGIYIDPELKTKLFIGQVKNALATKKPILIGEFGAANGDAISDQDTIGSPELQANTYRGVYQAIADLNDNQIIGTIGFQFYGRDKFTDAWAIAKNKGDFLFPVATVIKSYAKNNTILINNINFKNTGESYLLTNTENKGKKNINLGDKVGLKLNLSSDYNYMISISTPNILKQIEPLHYDQEHDSFYALYQASNSGSIQIEVTGKKICNGIKDCRDNSLQVFTYNLIVND